MRLESQDPEAYERGMILRSALVLLAVSVAATGCTPKKKSIDDSKSTAKDEEASSKKKKHDKGDDDQAGDDDKGEKKKGGSKSGCKEPTEDISGTFTIEKGCKLTMTQSWHVVDGGALIIEPGVKISSKGSNAINVSGKIVAKGTEDDPIVLTSANSSPSGGDWDGIVFEDQANAGSVLDHVTISYAGGGGGSAAKAGLTVYGDVAEKRISVTNSTFQHNAKCGVANDHARATFAKFEGNTFKDNAKCSLDIDPQALGSVGANNKFAEPIKVIDGDITSSITWPKSESPFVLGGNLDIKGKGEAAILTLPEKSTVRLAQGGRIDIGGDDGGGLVAKGVLFTSANGTPSEGDWEGLVFEEKVTGTDIEDSTFEYAGKSGSYGQGVLNFYGIDIKKAEKRVVVKGCTFRKNDGAAIKPKDGSDCGKYDDDNKIDENPCAK